MAVFLRRVFLAFVAAAVTCQALVTEEEIAEKAAQGLRLIDMEAGVDPVWMTEDEKLELIRADKNFASHFYLPFVFDVTETYDPLEAESFSAFRAGQFTYFAPSRRADVTPLINKISLSNMQGYLTNLTNFHNRYYRSTTGAAASVWIRDTVQEIATSYPTSKATVSLFSHSFVQSSIVARIPGKNPDAPLIVLGAHMDSINSRDTSGRAPGADDDGSGSVNLLEAFRVLVSSGFQPESPVEFHWYAGEEAGLLGSQAIARDYKSKNIQVRGMLQFDMTAFVKPGSTEVISLMPDFTNSELTRFIGALVDTYSTLKWAINNPCGYACSDHASWDRQGYPTALPFEGTYPANSNGVIHTASDTTSVNGFSWSHTLEYTKLAVAYAYELGVQ